MSGRAAAAVACSLPDMFKYYPIAAPAKAKAALPPKPNTEITWLTGEREWKVATHSGHRRGNEVPPLFDLARNLATLFDGLRKDEPAQHDASRAECCHPTLGMCRAHDRRRDERLDEVVQVLLGLTHGEHILARELDNLGRVDVILPNLVISNTCGNNLQFRRELPEGGCVLVGGPRRVAQREDLLLRHLSFIPNSPTSADFDPTWTAFGSASAEFGPESVKAGRLRLDLARSGQ